ncbi:MAG: polysaccharide biosynthesis/export family protein [Candidatus Margulisiibacteriota bacterium]
MKRIVSALLIYIHLTFVICNLSFAAEFTLANGDQLDLRVIGQDKLATKQTIAPDGSLSLPLLGRVIASGKTLKDFNEELILSFSSYIDNPQVVISLTPRPIYVIQHDLKKNTWDVKEAKSIAEARALAGKNFTGDIKYGDIINVEVGNKPDFLEENWYKIITATAVVAGVYVTLNR